MALTEFTEDVENISALPDEPAMTASQLKAKFDKAAKDIKSYINGTLKTFVDALYKKPDSGIPDADIASAATWNAKGTYSKPDGGIPKTDLASAVQTSLGKADSALQSIADSAVTTSKIAAGAVTSEKLAALTTLKVSGSAIYGSSFPANPVTGQVFFKKKGT